MDYKSVIMKTQPRNTNATANAKTKSLCVLKAMQINLEVHGY